MVMLQFMSMTQTETELPFIMPMGLLPHMNTTCSTDVFVRRLLTTLVIINRSFLWGVIDGIK